MEKSDWNNVKVSLWSISNLVWENMIYYIEIHTEQWYVYKTWLIDEHNFQCMAQQRIGDKIKEIKVMRWCETKLLTSINISDAVKEKLKAILK